MNTENHTPKSQPKFDEWALVELFGHQKIAGKVSEATIAGGAFLRVDVPETDGQPAYTRFYGPGAIYSINPTTEAIACSLASEYQTVPVQRYELPQLAEKVSGSSHDDGYGDPPES